MEREYKRRRNYFIDAKFQTNFIVKFCLIVILASLSIGALVILLSKDLTTVTIEDTKVLVRTTADFIFPIVIFTIIIVNIFTAVAVIILTTLTSHKIAGPLYRLKREIGHLREGKFSANFNIREEDQLQDLARSLSELVVSLRDRYSQLKDKVTQLKSILESSPQDRGAIITKLGELEGVLNQFEM